MNTYTIEQALEMVGQVVPRMEVKLVKIYDRKTGTGDYGPYSFQNGEVQDATGNIKIVFGNLPDQSGKLGRKLILKAMQTKHGLKGVETKNNEYQGKTTVELKLTKTALVLLEDEDSQGVQPDAPERLPEAKKQALSKPQDLKLGIALARNRMTQLGGLYALSFQTARSMETLTGLEIEGVKDVASCLFIQACREGLADSMPIRTIKDEAPADEGQDQGALDEGDAF